MMVDVIKINTITDADIHKIVKHVGTKARRSNPKKRRK